MRLRSILLFLLFAQVFDLSFTGLARASFSKEECFQEEGIDYCFFKANQGTNKNIIYYLHGKNADSRYWNKENALGYQIQKKWWIKKQIPPLVVSVSLGKSWLISPLSHLQASGLLEIFKNKIMPRVERLQGRPQKRIVLGNSMGGLNALILGLSLGDTFDKIIALCPGVFKQPLYSSDLDTRPIADEINADQKFIDYFIELTKKYVSNDLEWKKISPLHLIDSFQAPKTSFYLWSGKNDRHGGFKGSELLAQKISKKANPLTWMASEGGHCDQINFSSLAQALIDLNQ